MEFKKTPTPVAKKTTNVWTRKERTIAEQAEQVADLEELQQMWTLRGLRRHRLAGDTAGTTVDLRASDNRDNWTDGRAAFFAVDPVNAVSLEAIKSVMVEVRLDSTNTITCEDVPAACCFGNGCNRFYDKHQRIVFAEYDLHMLRYEGYGEVVINGFGA
ncbi:hypothetical protein B0H11DRAFT_2225093 [Mycena galericulata]|nr:hypothetical protein B0H11DRAFT_2225093 [Mycena galericulata]